MIQKKSVKSELFDNISRYFVNFGAVLFVLSIVAIVFNSIFGFSHSIAFSNWLLILISSTIMCIAAMLCNYYDYKGNLSFIRLLWEITYPVCLFFLPLIFIYLNFVSSGASLWINSVLIGLFLFSVILEGHLEDIE